MIVMMQYRHRNALVLCLATIMTIPSLGGCGQKSVREMTCYEYYEYMNSDYSHREAMRRMGPEYENKAKEMIQESDARGDSEGCKNMLRELYQVPAGQ